MMEKIAIYTCIIGGYDELQQPAVVEEGFDFICFVGPGERTAERVGVWEIRELTELPAGGPRMASRWPKMHPHVLLPEYECSVWIDGNVALLDGTRYRAAHIKAAAGVKYSGVTHPDRDCTYSEARKCFDMKYLNIFELLWVWAYLRVHGLPRLGRRDQLSLMWCLRRCGIPRDYLLPPGQNTRNHPGFRYLRHK